MLTSVQPRPIIVMLTLFVTIPWGHLTVLVYLDILEMGKRVLVSSYSYKRMVWQGLPLQSSGRLPQTRGYHACRARGGLL